MTMENLEGKRIALLLSGGVDSAVAVYKLVSQGLQPDCFYIKIGPEEEEEWNCTSEEDVEMATAIAERYGLSFDIVDCHHEYWDKVSRYTIEKVRSGFTPNPDVMCNRIIKFGAFDEKCGYNYDFIATGHYADSEFDSQGRKWLCTTPDPVKDQTDFLAQLYDWQLRKALFPIGKMNKEEVRLVAEREHLVNAHRKDSQGICFLGKIDYNEYIRRFLGEQRGDVIDLNSGRKIGEHRGHWFHTIGQRKGLGFSGGPWFVIRKDINRNVLYVSNGYDPKDAYKSVFYVTDMHLLTPGSVLPDQVSFKIRHTPDFYFARLTRMDDSVNGMTVWKVESSTPIHGVAPGQFCVIYDTSHHRCFGSAEITFY
ncbi:MAG: tRNA 2-thiouridine(34) synthase MnmA [bacterium]|nr:tRNA 2-thiouridine(34) synthase MnmA [Candidatus Minthenecus merdequi]